MNENRPIVLSLCDRTGNMLMPWAATGLFRCIAVDSCRTKDECRNGIEYVAADVMEYLPPNGAYAFAAAFPPCTDLAGSGASHFQRKGLGRLSHALAVVWRCKTLCEWTGAPWVLENPVGTMSTYWRKPDHYFNPCDFGGYLEPPADRYTKKTCLWAGNGFLFPEARAVEPTEGSRIIKMPDSAGRTERRNETPMGFAHAVFAANSRVAV